MSRMATNEYIGAIKDIRRKRGIRLWAELRDKRASFHRFNVLNYFFPACFSATRSGPITTRKRPPPALFIQRGV